MLHYLIGYFAFIVLAFTSEPYIDCTGWTGAALVEFEMRAVALDGTKVAVTVEMQPDTTPTHARDALETCLKSAGWRYRSVGKGLLFVEGSKDSPVVLIEFKSKQWKPAVVWSPSAPKK